MTDFINITDRQEFDQFLQDAKTNATWVVDTETNGLRYYRDNYIISISVYFPSIDVAYNLPFRHGEGHVDVHWNASNPVGADFHDMSWSGKPKKEIYLEYWFQQYAKVHTDFGNLPIEWYDELKAVWATPGVTMIFHNARFDLHMLEADGFPRPHGVEDTMILLHTVHEDWRGLDITAPYTYPKKDGKELAGQWATDSDGTLLTKVQPGNRKLKWQAAYTGLPGATLGETELCKSRLAFEETLTGYIMANLDHTMNEGLLYKTAKGQSGEGQRKRIRSKVQIDDKANMWMLPSQDVALYAMLDVVLTWGLREHYMPTLVRWGNVELYQHQNAVAYELCWRMERNGVKLDYDNAVQEIGKLDVMLDYVQGKLDVTLPDVNVGSPTQLLKALNDKGYPVSATDKAAFDPYSDDLIIKDVLEYRKIKKSRDTYLKRWLTAVDDNGLIHGGMNADGTVSGRLSSSGEAGNWQNIPDRGGYTVKRAIIPYSDEWVFFAIDYGQVEARVAAWMAEVLLAQTLNMVDLFESGVDLHTYTANMVDVRKVVFGDLSQIEICDKLGYDLNDPKITKTPDEIATDHCRHIGKTMNFGLIYSGGKRMLAKLLKIDEDVAAILVAKWRTLFPAFASASRHYTWEAMQWRSTPDGIGMGQYVTQPISGRHRKLHKYSESKWYYEGGERLWFNPQEASSRKVFNNLVQGLCGYICLTSGLNINRKYGDDKLRMFANIHDALDGYIHVDHMHIIKDIMAMMIDWPEIRPSLTVDLEGSTDGTWQGMSEVHDIDLWIESKGEDGYADS